MIKKILFGMAFAVLAAIPGYGQVVSAIEEEEFEEEGDLVPAPDFTLKSIDGQDVSLVDFQGNWVVLDFWGAWCKWCIKGIPEMKETYKKYHDMGLEIIGIDCRDTPDQWKAAVAQYQLPWVNVYNPEGSNLLTEYAIQGFPTKILVNPEGYLYEIFIGEDPAFYEYIDSIFSF